MDFKERAHLAQVIAKGLRDSGHAEKVELRQEGTDFIMTIDEHVDALRLPVSGKMEIADVLAERYFPELWADMQRSTADPESELWEPVEQSLPADTLKKPTLWLCDATGRVRKGGYRRANISEGVFFNEAGAEISKVTHWRPITDRGNRAPNPPDAG